MTKQVSMVDEQAPILTSLELGDQRVGDKKPRKSRRIKALVRWLSSLRP